MMQEIYVSEAGEGRYYFLYYVELYVITRGFSQSAEMAAWNHIFQLRIKNFALDLNDKGVTRQNCFVSSFLPGADDLNIELSIICQP